MYITTAGLVLRETEYKESSRILTVLTAAEGKLTMLARGAKRKGSKLMAATQPLAFSEMTLYERGGRWTLTEARVIELFSGLRDELELMALGTYFAEALDALSDEDSPDPEILAIGLNSLFALGEQRKPPELVKAAFETRLMSIAGFEPMLECCAVCGEEAPKEPRLSLSGGVLHCRSCVLEGDGRSAELSAGALDAMRHIVNADPKKFCSFTLGRDNLKILSNASEEYFLTQADRGFRTLDFYKSVRITNDVI